MRWTALLLACYIGLGSLFPRTDFSQLTRMYALWQHYQCHQETEPSDTYTFWNFLLEHYASKHNFQTEASHSHQQLPFQHFAAGLCALPPIAIPVFPVKENIIERQSPHAIQFFHSTLPIDGPFRPPVA